MTQFRPHISSPEKLGRERGAVMQRWTRPFSTRRVRGRGRACMAWRGARTRLFSPRPRVLVPNFLVTSSVTNLDTYNPDLDSYKRDKDFFVIKKFCHKKIFCYQKYFFKNFCHQKFLLLKHFFIKLRQKKNFFFNNFAY